MAPAAFHTVMQNLKDLEITKKQLESGWYDKIITGDLGKIGKQALAEFIRNEGLEAEEFLMDCGMEIYDSSAQDTHAGGSGCGCSAAVLCGYILPRIQQGEWKRVLLCPQEPCFPRSASMKEKASQASPMGWSWNAWTKEESK